MFWNGDKGFKCFKNLIHQLKQQQRVFPARIIYLIKKIMPKKYVPITEQIISEENRDSSYSKNSFIYIS